MGEIAMIASAASTIGGTATEALGAKYEGEAQKASALYNARAAMIQAREQSDAIRTQGRQVAAQNITRIAKSGVRLEGSPLAVLAENAFRTEKQALNALRTGKAIDTLYRMEGRQAIIASRFKIAQAVFRGLGSATGGSAQGFAFGGSGGSGGGSGGGGGGGGGAA